MTQTVEEAIFLYNCRFDKLRKYAIVSKICGFVC